MSGRSTSRPPIRSKAASSARSTRERAASDVSDKSPSELKTLGDWGEARAHGSDLDPTHTFDLGGIKANSVLLWLTQLPAGQNGKHYVDVSEVRVA